MTKIIALQSKQFLIHYEYINDRNKKVPMIERVKATNVKDARTLAIKNIEKLHKNYTIIKIQTVGG